MICVVGVYLSLSASTIIECTYSISDWYDIKNIYTCVNNKDPSITTRESATITSFSDNHISEKTHSDIEGIDFSYRTINYFPRGLETFSKNIKAIQIFQCKLKEIHQEDLKPLPKLIYINMHTNYLEVLEEGLFDFNPDLEFIQLNQNQIVQIGPKVFDHLSKLRNLLIFANDCTWSFSYGKNKTNVFTEAKDIIQLVKSHCINAEFSSLKENLEILEKESKTLNAEDFNEKLLTFEKSLNFPKLVNFSRLNNKLKTLKNLAFRNLNPVKNDTTKRPHSNDSALAQCSLNDGLKVRLDDIKSSIDLVCTKASLNQTLNQFKENILNSQNKISTKIDDSHNIVKSTINLGNTILSDSIKTLKTSQDEIKSSIGDIEATLSGLKSSQKEMKVLMDRLMKKFEEVLEVKMVNLIERDIE